MMGATGMVGASTGSGSARPEVGADPSNLGSGSVPEKGPAVGTSASSLANTKGSANIGTSTSGAAPRGTSPSGTPS
jgi:hypothetical protein